MFSVVIIQCEYFTLFLLIYYQMQFVSFTHIRNNGLFEFINNGVFAGSFCHCYVCIFYVYFLFLFWAGYVRNFIMRFHSSQSYWLFLFVCGYTIVVSCLLDFIFGNVLMIEMECVSSHCAWNHRLWFGNSLWKVCIHFLAESLLQLSSFGIIMNGDTKCFLVLHSENSL